MSKRIRSRNFLEEWNEFLIKKEKENGYMSRQMFGPNWVWYNFKTNKLKIERNHYPNDFFEGMKGWVCIGDFDEVEP